MDPAYRAALLDWMACAVGGRGEPAAGASRSAGEGLLEAVAALGTAGHVLDFDDTYLPGIAHLSAPVAPAAIGVGAQIGATVGDVVSAYADGFEAMGALARRSHPGLYDGGWHPTAVCGSLGAAVAAASLLELDAESARHARRLALARAGGTLSAFGSDAKSLQVGMAAATGVQAAQLAAGGARAGAQIEDSLGTTFSGAAFAEPDPRERAVDQNWIKAWPCCLMAHGAIECATQLGGQTGRLTAVVHPVARRAAPYDDVTDGLQAKFSIPYLTAYTLLRGEPSVASFAEVNHDVGAYAREDIVVRVDPELAESEAVIADERGDELARVTAARGSPQRPLGADALAAKVQGLAGGALDGILDSESRPAAELRDAIAA